MKKLIFLFVSVFIVWKFNIIDITLNKYFDYKHKHDTSKINIYDEKSQSPTINISEDIVMPEIKIKQYSSNKEKLDSIVIPRVKPRQKIQSKPIRKYRCDGRQHCSQMKSYEEAKFFIRNCPNTKMDGDHDGIPCERQFGRR